MLKKIYITKTLIKKIIAKLIVFQILELFKNLEKYFDKYPKAKKNMIDAIKAPMPK